ncbi:MAG: RNA polymerase sigma factor [Candidatus Liptonbacteria bacterium]|nr:RNA polymerase sigma factor [Candidatus Liptonbacteria bacterium]
MVIRPDMSDEVIAAEAQQGNVEAFGELVKRYEEKLMRYGRRFLASGDDVKDIVQDAFLKAYVNIKGFDATRKFSSWMYRIAHNEFVNALKKKSGREMFSLFDFDTILPHPVAEETADGEAQRNELRRMLDRYLASLGAKYREPLVLYYYEDMDYKEIADILRIPVSTVGVRLRRGKDALREAATKLQLPYDSKP